MRYGWSLDRGDWERLHLALEAGASGTWHRVKELSLPLELMVPTKSGVYLLCARPASLVEGMLDQLYNVVYVGQAQNLRARFIQHCKSPSPDVARAKGLFGASHIEYWFLQVGIEHLDDAERELIFCLGPSANRVAGRIRAVLRPAISL